MALKTKIKLGVGRDYKAFKIASMTGTGVTGYGANQDPVGYREASANTVDLYGYRMVFTSPSGQVITKIGTQFDAFKMAEAFGEFYTVFLNTDLGYTADEQIEDGLWKVEQTEFFPNNVTTTIAWTGGDNFFAYENTNVLSFKNANCILLSKSGSGLTTGNFDSTRLYNITSINTVIDPTFNKITVSRNITQSTTSNYSTYVVGYTSTKYFPVAKSIKECLDNKVADLVECECDEVDAELVNKYLLYDAMFVNCEIDNINKAQQIFDLLSKYCDDNCGCD